MIALDSKEIEMDNSYITYKTGEHRHYCSQFKSKEEISNNYYGAKANCRVIINRIRQLALKYGNRQRAVGTMYTASSKIDEYEYTNPATKKMSKEILDLREEITSANEEVSVQLKEFNGSTKSGIPIPTLSELEKSSINYTMECAECGSSLLVYKVK